jgi:hypothetical protein
MTVRSGSGLIVAIFPPAHWWGRLLSAQVTSTTVLMKDTFQTISICMLANALPTTMQLRTRVLSKNVKLLLSQSTLARLENFRSSTNHRPFLTFSILTRPSIHRELGDQTTKCFPCAEMMSNSLLHIWKFATSQRLFLPQNLQLPLEALPLRSQQRRRPLRPLHQAVPAMNHQ